MTGRKPFIFAVLLVFLSFFLTFVISLNDIDPDICIQRINVFSGDIHFNKILFRLKKPLNLRQLADCHSGSVI
jgi:hypothetical protein